MIELTGKMEEGIGLKRHEAGSCCCCLPTVTWSKPRNRCIGSCSRPGSSKAQPPPPPTTPPLELTAASLRAENAMTGYLTQQGASDLIGIMGLQPGAIISGGSLAGATSVGAIEGIYSGQDLPGGAGQPFSFVLLFQNHILNTLNINFLAIKMHANERTNGNPRGDREIAYRHADRGLPGPGSTGGRQCDLRRVAAVPDRCRRYLLFPLMIR